jgi:hypothetical protein
MANLAKVVQQLELERDQAQKRLEQLNQALKALGDLGGLRRRNGRGQRPIRRRAMSTAARRRIAAAQRARWTKWRASQPGKAKA